MKKIFYSFSILFCVSSIYCQTFEIKQITNGDFDARNPFISLFGIFGDPLIYYEKHIGSSSNIALIEYDIFANSFQELTELTTGNALHISPYEDFNHGIVYQTNENGNWDIAYRAYENGVWGPITFLANTPDDEINLSTFYASDPFYLMNNFILFQRNDTIIVLEYNESMKVEYPVFVTTPQFQYSDFIGVFYYNFPGIYPRIGIHVIAVEKNSSGEKSLVYKYKPLAGQWGIKSIIKENCNCSNPVLQFFGFSPYLIFEDSTLAGVRPFMVYDWDHEKEIDSIPILLAGDVSGFKCDRILYITSNPLSNSEIEYLPHSYFVKNVNDFKIRLNKIELGDIVGDTLINVSYESSKMTLRTLGFSLEQIFYTIWEDSSDGHIHLFGRRQLYPVDAVSDENGIDGFLLEQNYPNPFNPSTKIQYAIGSRQFVTLKVYDVLGNEITTLVNEELSAGEYEAEFNCHSVEGRNLTSGVYFYQLVVRGSEINSEQAFIQSRKMVYLK